MVHSIDDARRLPSDDDASSGGPAPAPRGAGRVPPHNLEAEESLLGAMMLSRDALTAAVEERLEPRDFYKPAHGVIFEATLILHSRGEPIDPVTVAEELRRVGQLDTMGGRATLLADPGVHTRVGERRALRAHRRRARVVAPTHRDRRQHPARWPTGPTTTSTITLDRAEAAIFEVAEQARERLPEAAAPRARADDGSARGPVRPRRRHHRRADRLSRPRRPLARAAAVDADRCRRPSRSGQDVVRARRRAELRARRGASRCCSSRWRWATSSSRSASSRPKPKSIRASSRPAGSWSTNGRS